MALQYEQKIISGKLERIDERCARAKQNGPYLLRDVINITMDDLSWAVGGSVKTVSGTSLSVDLVDLFRETAMQSFMVLVHEIAEEAESNVSDGELWLTIVK